MFGNIGDMFQNIKDVSKLTQDENVRAFVAHPKVQKLMQDPKFQDVVKEKNMFKLMGNPEFTELLKDPEIQSLIRKMSASSGR